MWTGEPERFGLVGFVGAALLFSPVAGCVAGGCAEPSLPPAEPPTAAIALELADAGRSSSPSASPTAVGGTAEGEPGGRDRGPAAAPDAGPCDDSLGSRLAQVSCDGTRILVAHPVALHPKRTIPEQPVRKTLDAVARLMAERPDIQLLRIEVYTSRRVGDSAGQRRGETLAAQGRADSVFRYLWRRRGVSAERMEAVGYGQPATVETPASRWPAVLHIVQRAAPR